MPTKITYDDITDPGPPLVVLFTGVKNRLIARISNKKLIDYTNQDNYNADDINDTFFEASFNDAMELFDTHVGDYAFYEYPHDLGAIKFLTLAYLFIYASDSTFSNFYMSTAQFYMLKALMYRHNNDLIEPEDQTDQEFTNREKMINSIPKPTPTIIE